MKTRILPIFSTFAFGLSLSDRTFAQANLGQSSAQDISVSVDVTGSTLSLPIVDIDLGVGPLNSTSGIAPVPYNTPVLPPVAAGADIDPLVSLNVNVSVDELRAQSDVDNLSGPRIANGVGSLASAGLSLDLSLGGLIPVASILSLEVGDTAVGLLTSTANVGWDDTTATPTAGSNLLALGSNGISLAVLGVPIDLAPFGLTAGVQANIPINISVPLGLFSATVTGNLLLTPDAVTMTGPGVAAQASATSLLAEASLNVSVDLLAVNEATLSVDVNASINETSAALSGSPVPEPAGVALLLAGSMLTAMRRRRA